MSSRAPDLYAGTVPPIPTRPAEPASGVNRFTVFAASRTKDSKASWGVSISGPTNTLSAYGSAPASADTPDVVSGRALLASLQCIAVAVASHNFDPSSVHVALPPLLLAEAVREKSRSERGQRNADAEADAMADTDAKDAAEDHHAPVLGSPILAAFSLAPAPPVQATCQFQHHALLLAAMALGINPKAPAPHSADNPPPACAIPRGKQLLSEIPVQRLTEICGALRPSFRRLQSACQGSESPDVIHALTVAWHTALAAMLTVRATKFGSASKVEEDIDKNLANQHAMDLDMEDASTYADLVRELATEQAKRQKYEDVKWNDNDTAAPSPSPADAGADAAAAEAEASAPAQAAGAAAPAKGNAAPPAQGTARPNLPLPPKPPARHAIPIPAAPLVGDLLPRDPSISSEAESKLLARLVTIVIRKYSTTRDATKALRSAMQESRIVIPNLESKLIAIIIGQHPPSDPMKNAPLPPLPPNSPAITVINKMTLAATRQAASGDPAPGPSGVSCRVVHQLVTADPVILAGMTAFLQVLCNGQLDSHDGHQFVTAGLAALINKRVALAATTEVSPSSPSQSADDASETLRKLLELNHAQEVNLKIRTINQGESVLKIADILCLQLVVKEALPKALQHQYAIGLSGGAEILLHVYQQFVDKHGHDPEVALLLLDITNAFMAADRSKMIAAVFGIPELQPIWRLAHWHLAKPNPRFLTLGDGSLFSFLQSVGGPQGDPLMPVMFAALIGVLLKRLKATGREDLAILLGAYLDDTTAGAKIDDITRVLVAAKELSPELCGFEVNDLKSQVVSFSKTPSPKVLAMAAQFGVTVQHEMCSFVGGVVGTDTVRMEQFMVDQVIKHRQLFMVLSHRHMPPIVALQLLKSAACPVMNHLLRSHPPEITRRAAALFDRCVEATIIAIMQVPDMLLPANAAALSQLRLPGRLGGDAFPRLTDVANAAYYAAALNSAAHVAQAVPQSAGPARASASQPPRAPAVPVPAPGPAPTFGSAPKTGADPIDAMNEPAAAAAAASRPPPDVPDPDPRTSPPRTMRERAIADCSSALTARAPAQFAKTPLPATNTINPQNVYSNKAQAPRWQRVIMAAIALADHEQLKNLVKANTRATVRLTALQAKGANAMLNADLSDPTQCLSPIAARHNFRALHGLAPSLEIAANPLATCCCGFLLADDFDHFKTCAQFRLQQNQTHNAVRDRYRDLLSDAGAHGSTELTIPGTQAKEGKKGSGRRVDVTARFPGVLFHDWCDVSITNPVAQCYLSSRASLTDPMFALHARAQVKRNKYELLIDALGGHFVPLIHSTFGNGTPAAHSFLHKIANTAKYTQKVGDFSVKAMSTRIAAVILEHASFCTEAGLGRMHTNWVPHDAAT